MNESFTILHFDLCVSCKPMKSLHELAFSLSVILLRLNQIEKVNEIKGMRRHG
jgi:hypothetical protein